MRTGWKPSPEEFSVFPELAFLAVLDQALATTKQVVLASHQELDETSHIFDWSTTSKELRLADDIVYASDSLRRRIHEYREHVALFVRPIPTSPSLHGDNTLSPKPTSSEL